MKRISLNINWKFRPSQICSRQSRFDADKIIFSKAQLPARKGMWNTNYACGSSRLSSDLKKQTWAKIMCPIYYNISKRAAIQMQSPHWAIFVTQSIQVNTIDSMQNAKLGVTNFEFPHQLARRWQSFKTGSLINLTYIWCKWEFF